jgi:hypothetical protein
MPNHATNFEIRDIVLETISGAEIDIHLLIDEFNVYESLFNATISADFVIDDANNIIKNLPITGHEYLRFSFKTPGQNWVKCRLRVYKIGQRQLERERRQIFILYCIDNTDFINAQVRVSKAYKQKLISDIANDIQTTYLQSSFINIETTKNLHHIITPYWTPSKTISFLASRANSVKYQGSNYVYFETVDGFSFCSIESLVDKQSPIKNYIHQPANVRKDNPVGYKPRTLDTDYVALQSFEIKNNFDTMENCMYGMYTSRLLWHDIQNKQFGINDFDYPSSYSNYKHVEANTVQGGSSYLWTPKSDYNQQPYGELKVYPIGLPGQQNYVIQWMQQRISQMQQIQNIRILATIPGDSTRRSGDLVSITLPSPEAPINDQQPIDSYLTNRYLVTGVRHVLNRKQFVTHLELTKDSIFKSY